MFYGVIHENYDYVILSEFDLMGTINSIRTKIKNVIVSLIDKIDSFLDGCRDSKIKSILKSLLSKLRNLLTKADKINTTQDANKVNDEYKQCGEEFKKVTKTKSSDKSTDILTKINNDNDIPNIFKQCANEGKYDTCFTILTNQLFIIAAAKDASLEKRCNKMWNYYKQLNPDGIGNDYEEEFFDKIKDYDNDVDIAKEFAICDKVNDKMYKATIKKIKDSI